MNYIQVAAVKDGSPIAKRCIMGSGDFLRPDNMEQVCLMLDKYLEVGGNTFDTAHQYIGSETAIGKWMEMRGNREKVIVLTKGAHHDDGEPGPRVNPGAITRDLMESLERLKTDYVDLYALHRDDPSVEVGPIMDVLNEHIASGRIHAIGASNWTHQRIQEANDYAQANGLIGFTFNSPNLSLAKCRVPRWAGCVSADHDTCAWHENNQMPLLSWSSQAGGFFSGRFAPDKLDNEEMVNVYYTEDNWERYRRAQLLAERKHVSTIQIALAFVLNQPFPTAALIGPETPAELLSSVEGASIRLTDGEIRWLDLQTDTLSSN
ncbi:aldo/keto reductase [Gordoniibacillus kamchatkensis]|uniref:Aldo/keto reductase n=1 Tax=Gordoniibacillus kamchatkensis TaxID=1590651 RepID=A0ABR5AIP2_9BACL|nr:aldo/keto reductase [Paenibacillus sp. VKM B-2647]KIL40906.1 aldo/keto reductase [Paenibacillus sp. VKM B-2647]